MQWNNKDIYFYIFYLIKDAAIRFYGEYNGITYNAIEPEECLLVFVEKIESVYSLDLLFSLKECIYIHFLLNI